MKLNLTHCCFAAFVLQAYAKKGSYEITFYTPSKNWNKEKKENILRYKIINQQKKTCCPNRIYRSTTTNGSAEQHFENDCQELMVNKYKITGASKMTYIPEAGGWKIKKGMGTFIFENSPFPGLQEMSLMLQADQQTQRDGPFQETTS